MWRLRLLQEKHKGEEHTCRECIEFGSKSCEGALPNDKAGSCFAPRAGRLGRDSSEKTRRGKNKEWKLSLYEDVPKTLKPCGFYEDTLTESAWLPYKDQEGNVTLRPSIIMMKKNEKEPKILDFYKQEIVKGTFPSQELQSLMDKQAVQMLTSHANIEPKEIDKKIDEAFKKHLDMPQAERILAKRWIEGTFFYDIFDAFPIESILGVSESGKSRLCNLNQALCYHAEGLIDPREAPIFRSKEEDKVTLIIDESEYLNNPNLYQTIRILLNASYSKYSGYVTRYDEEDGKRVKKRFDLYSPMCVSGIAGLEGVTLSRAFRIIMKRVNKDFPKANPNDYNTLRNMLYTLRLRHAFQIKEIYDKTDISNIVTARFEELFKPLFAMTTFFGDIEEWNILKEWCSEYQQNFRAESLNVAQEEMTLITIPKLTKNETQPDWYTLKELSDKVNAEYNRKVSSAYVSNILTRLGITKRKKVKGYTLFYCSNELLDESSQRIGLCFDATKSTDSTNSKPDQKQEKNWLQKALKKEAKHDKQN